MAKHIHTLAVNFTGGIISPGKLLELLRIAANTTVTHIRFGLRQEVLLDVPEKYLPHFTKACNDAQINISTTPNILSSYVAADIFVGGSWLTEGIYKDVFNQLDHLPMMKINICDGRQTFAPLFTGHINWVSAASPHYWHLYLRPPGTQELYAWPELIYTNSIGAMSKQVEMLLQQGLAPEQVYHVMYSAQSYISREREGEPDLPAFHLPYYEGFNKHQHAYWLGIYRREENFSIDFLKDICTICMETRVGQLYSTPWKSLVIKDIDTAHRGLWDYVLGKHGINVRHAANELNWQVEDNCEDGLVLKRHIIRYFDSADVRTYGLCFSVKVIQPVSLFGNIVIRRRENRHGSRLKYMQRYDILHTAGFKANSAALVLYREDVAKEHLGPYVAALCKMYYEQKSELDILQHYVAEQQSAVPGEATVHTVYQCRSCLTVYDPSAGDPGQCIVPGTPFNELPADYHCSVCESSMNFFEAVKTDALFSHP
ncbi:rubredoxin [Chitinophaga vietnamensis]|uniref:rubredoxin n=1 Tax=Chitinophaga vietnamensis TaxID=2593957 RepID=UPI00117829B6|nr:rubredoxin [Chitinophaga vietnamensis]